VIDVTVLLIGQLVLRDRTAHTAPAKMVNLSKPKVRGRGSTNERELLACIWIPRERKFFHCPCHDFTF